MAGLSLVLLVVVLAPAPIVNPIVNRAASGHGGDCAELSGVSVDSGSWPVVARAAAGQLRGVSAHADEVRFDGGFTIYDVDFSAEQVNVPALRFGIGDDDADVSGGESAGTVRLEDLEEAIAEYDITVELHGEETSLLAEVDVPVLGDVPTTVDLIPFNGNLELRFTAYDSFELPPLVIDFPDQAAVQDVEIMSDSLRVTTSVEGAIAADWACGTEATTEAAAG